MDRLSHSELLQLKRWNTPTIYNGWEAITTHDRARGHFNIEETHDFMPQMGPMVGYAVTVVCEPSNPDHVGAIPDAWGEYRRYVAQVQGPKIVVVRPKGGGLWRRGRGRAVRPGAHAIGTASRNDYGVGQNYLSGFGTHGQPVQPLAQLGRRQLEDTVHHRYPLGTAVEFKGDLGRCCLGEVLGRKNHTADCGARGSRVGS